MESATSPGGGDPTKDALTIVLVTLALTYAVRKWFKPALKGKDFIAPKYASLGYLFIACLLVWFHYGRPLPALLKPHDDARLDTTKWHHAYETNTPYRWWQFGTFGVDTIMPAPACTHYDRARQLQKELLTLPAEPTQRELMELTPMAANERVLRFGSVMNSSLNALEQCFMPPREEHLLLTTTMPYLTTDAMAPSLIDFVRKSPHRDLLSAPSDGRVDDVFVSRLGELFARAVAVTKQAPTSKHEVYSLTLKRVLLPLAPLLQTVQAWYDEQLAEAEVQIHIDECHPLSLDGIFRSGLYVFFDRRTRRFSLLARMHISNRNELFPELVQVGKMPFVDYLNPHPAYVYRRLPESLQAPFTYPARFQISYYNLTRVLTDYALLRQRVNGEVISRWLPPIPDMNGVSVDHVPLAIAPLEKLTEENKEWIEQDEVTRCIIKCEQIEEALLKAASGGG